MFASDAITQISFVRAFGARIALHYDGFCRKVDEELERVLDSASTLEELKILSASVGAVGNVHGRLYGKVSRWEERGEIHGEIVWLNRLKTFRGGLWVSLKPMSDYDLYMRARDLFRSGKYEQFLQAHGFVGGSYRGSPVMLKMVKIARDRDCN